MIHLSNMFMNKITMFFSLTVNSTLCISFEPDGFVRSEYVYSAVYAVTQKNNIFMEAIRFEEFQYQQY